MAFDKKGLDDYVDVATRITEFRAKHPAGYLAPADMAEPFRIVEVTGTDRDGKPVTQTFITVVAAAFRDPDDHSPGVGMAWEVFPGRTPYTRGSELMNAETSAWGRAIIAVGAADSRAGIASAEEVRNRQAERDEEPGEASRGSSWRPPAHPSSRKAQRSRGALPDDQWTTVPQEERPGSSTLDQQQRIAVLLAAKGIGRREDKLAFCTLAAQREIKTSKELSYLEAEEALRQAAALEPEEAPQ